VTDADAIDRQVDDLYRKHPADSHDVSPQQRVTQRIDNRNTISTPVILGFLIMMGMFALGLTIVGLYCGNAAASAAQAERNAKLAQYQTEEAIKKWEEERRK